MSLIELIFTNNEDNITKHGTTDPIADHDGIFVSFHCKMYKEKVISKDVFDYKNIDEIGLRNYIKAIDFQSSVFTQPIKEQANKMTKILQSALKKFVPIKKIIIKPSDQPWVNSYTRLLMRKKNRNYHLYKKISFEYLNSKNIHGVTQETITRLKEKKDKAFRKSKYSAIESQKANLRVKNAFFNTVNSTLQNHEISAKKKFSILTKLMKSQKLSSIPPIISKNEVINDAQRKSDIFNDLFTAKATVEGNDDPVSVLEPLDNILESLDQINTSPIEISKIFRQLKSVTLRTVVFLVNSSI